MPSAIFSATVSDGTNMKVLMDHADAVLNGILRIADGRFRAVDANLPFVRMVQAVEHLHQRRFARAILAQQRVDLARVHIEVDLVRRQTRPESA